MREEGIRKKMDSRFPITDFGNASITLKSIIPKRIYQESILRPACLLTQPAFLEKISLLAQLVMTAETALP